MKLEQIQRFLGHSSMDMDEGGISIKELTKACSENNVIAVYLMPEFNFPDTRSMSKRRIEQIVVAQKEWGFHYR